MKQLSRALFACSAITLMIVGGLAVATVTVLGFALWPLPTPEVQIQMVTSEPEIVYQVITATPLPPVYIPTTAPIQEQIVVVVTATPQPTVMEFQPELATAYPIQPTPTPLAQAPLIHTSGGIPIKGYGYSWNTNLDKSDLSYATGTRFCIGGT